MLTLDNDRLRTYYTHVPKRQTGKWGAEVTKALQQAIRDSDLSMNEVARRAGIDPGMVCRFANSERGMTLATAAKVAKVLGLEIVIRPIRQRKGR